MAAFGFRPSRYMNGSPWNGATVRYSILATNGTACFVGDTVIGAGTASISPVDGAILHDVTFSANGNKCLGVITSVVPTTGTPNLNIIYGAASTYREVMVAIAEPWLVFETTCDEAIITSAIGSAYDLAVTAGSTVTGLSGHSLDATSPSTTIGTTWAWIGVRNDPANLATLITSSTTTVASTAAAPTIVEVVCVEPQLFPTAVGAGV